MKKINFQIYKQKKKQRISFVGVSPKADWVFILIVGFLLLLIGIGYAVWLYIKVNNGSLFEIVEDTTGQTEFEKQKKEINKAVEIFSKETAVPTPVIINSITATTTSTTTAI